MTAVGYVVVAVVVLAATAWFVWRRRRARVRSAPFPPQAQRRFRLEEATAYAAERLRRCTGLSDPDLGRLVDHCATFVAAESRPMNGGGPRDGWLVPPSVFEVVSHLRREADAAGVDVEDECLWEVVNLHDEYLRTLL